MKKNDWKHSKPNPDQKPVLDTLKESMGQIDHRLREATEASAILKELARVLHIAKHGKEPIESALPTVEDMAGKRCIETESVKAFFKHIGEPKKSRAKHYFDTDEKGEIVKIYEPTDTWKPPPDSSVIYWRFLWGAVHGLDGESIEAAHTLWIDSCQDGYVGTHPLLSIVKTWIDRPPRKIEKASLRVVDDLATVPYIVSEINRTRWEYINADVDVIEVDGEPIVTHITDFKTRQRKGDLKAFKPANTQGQLSLGIPLKRQSIAQPIPLIAYSEFGGDLHSSTAADVSVLLFLAHASGQALEMNHKEGAQLLARNRQGGFRQRIEKTDEQRFIDAWTAVRSMMVWIERDGLFIPYDLATCSRIDDETVSLSKPLWSRRKDGQWTLTAGYGTAGKNRLKGKIDDGGIWRTIAGIEYYLARGFQTLTGDNAGIAQPLTPAQKGGAGAWQKVYWRTFMRLTGDVWNNESKTEYDKVRKRKERLIKALKKAGYEAIRQKNGRITPAPAGDTVEFLFEKRGLVLFRATARFVEAAKKAQAKQWESANLKDFLGVE